MARGELRKSCSLESFKITSEMEKPSEFRHATSPRMQLWMMTNVEMRKSAPDLLCPKVIDDHVEEPIHVDLVRSQQQSKKKSFSSRKSAKKNRMMRTIIKSDLNNRTSINDRVQLDSNGSSKTKIFKCNIAISKEDDDDKEQSFNNDDNKVTLFVPYSDPNNLDLDSDDIVDKRYQSSNKFHMPILGDTGCSGDNIVFCDTRIILKINSQRYSSTYISNSNSLTTNGSSVTSTIDRESNVDEELLHEVGESPLYSLINKSKQLNLNEDCQSNHGSVSNTGTKSSTSSSSSCNPDYAKVQKSKSSETNEMCPSFVPVARKDLYKLLGLIDQCRLVSADLASPNDIQIAQRLAMDNVMGALSLDKKQLCYKKNLVKFFGVDEATAMGVYNSAKSRNKKVNMEKSSRIRRKPLNKPVTVVSKHHLLNFGHVVRNKMSWRIGNSAVTPNKLFQTSGSKHQDGVVCVSMRRARNNRGPLSMVASGSISSTDELKGDQEAQQIRLHHKDLNRYLGFDDSDSEELIFIQNKKKTTRGR